MIRCGIDIVRIARLESVAPAILTRFIQRVYTEAEQAQAKGSLEQLAGLFAAKEAAAKALGTGIGKVAWRDIEIVHGLSGEPRLQLHGHAKEIAERLGLNEWAVSISHDAGIAAANVVALGDGQLGD
ncbi:MAG: holo-ACP synthase [Anaerolineaceae bacterium]|nr:holo-ACP synthase [Anaerolineaceae bacterium]